MLKLFCLFMSIFATFSPKLNFETGEAALRGLRFKNFFVMGISVTYNLFAPSLNYIKINHNVRSFLLVSQGKISTLFHSEISRASSTTVQSLFALITICSWTSVRMLRILSSHTFPSYNVNRFYITIIKPSYDYK